MSISNSFVPQPGSTSGDLIKRRSDMAVRFRARFDSEPELWARAPGRVDLMGTHTDYNLGFVLTLPISRDTWFAARANGTDQVRLHSATLDQDSSFSLGQIERLASHHWSNYVRGVASVLQLQGFRTLGFDAVIHSTLPLESGLSSSAALECAAAVVFRNLGGWTLPPEALARLCQRAENEFVGVNCGILDQYSSCLGEENCALLLDCRTLSTELVPIPEGISIVICNTRAPRQLSGAEYVIRRNQCEQGARHFGVGALRDLTTELLHRHGHLLPEDIHRRCSFIVAENERVLELSKALRTGDRHAIGRLTAESFHGAEDLFEICSPPMTAMMRAIHRAPGLIGARQAGGGFGGSLVAFVEKDRVNDFRAAVSACYADDTGLSADVFAVKAAARAGLVRDDPEEYSRDGTNIERKGDQR